MKHYFASFQLGSRDIQSCIVCSTERWREGCIWFDIKYQQCFSEISYCSVSILICNTSVSH